MGVKKQTLVVSTIILVILTIFTAKEQAHVDGLSQYGFPFRFYSFSYCREARCLQRSGFQFMNLCYDLFLTLSAAFLLVKIKNRLFNTPNS